MNGTAITIPTGRRHWYPKRIKYVAPYTTRDALLHGRVGIRWYSSAGNDADDRPGAPGPSRHRLHDRRVRPTQPSSHAVPHAGTLGPRCPRLPKLVESAGLRVAAFTPIGLGRYLAAPMHSLTSRTSTATGTGSKWWRRAGVARHGVPYVSAPNGTAPRIERRQALKRVWDTVWGQRDLAGAAAVLAVSQAERAQLLAMGVEPRGSASSPTRWILTSGRRRRLEAASGGSTVWATRRWSCSWARSRRASGSTW